MGLNSQKCKKHRWVRTGPYSRDWQCRRCKKCGVIMERHKVKGSGPHPHHGGYEDKGWVDTRVWSGWKKVKK